MKALVSALLLAVFICSFMHFNSNEDQVYFRGNLSKPHQSAERSVSSEPSKTCDFSFDRTFLENEVKRFSNEDTDLYSSFVLLAARSLFLRGEEVQSCSAISCLYEKVYKKAGFSDEKAFEIGHKAALYYIKTGTVLVADKRHRFTIFYNSNGQKIDQGELSEHLFKENEVDAFWRLTHAYSEKVMRISSLKFLYRVRAGYTISGKEKNGAFTSLGYIVFQDGGLTTGREYPDFITSSQTGSVEAPLSPYSFLYNTGLHERGHQIHWQPGFHSLKHGGLNWKQISGTVLVESFANAEYTEIDISSQTTVREYGETNWLENFAEVIAHYRLNPVQQKRLALPSYNFVKTHVFEGREYTLSGDKAAFSKAVQGRVLSKDFTTCAQQKNTDGSAERKLSDCVVNLVDQFLEQTVEEVSFESPEFCYVKNNFISEVQSTVHSNVVRLLEGTVFFAEEYQEFVDLFVDKYDLTAFAMLASNKVGGSDLFQKEVREVFFKESKQIFSEDLRVKAWTRFEKQVSYKDLLYDARAHYKDLLFSDSTLQKYARSLWEKCLSDETVYDAVQSTFKTQFSYIDQQHMNCLSNNAENILKEAFDESWSSVETKSSDELRKEDVRKLLHSLMQSVFFVHLEQNERVQFAIESDFAEKFLSELDQQNSIEEIKEVVFEAQERQKFVFIDLEAEVIKKSDPVLHSLLRERMLSAAQNSYACFSLVVRVQLELSYGDTVESLASELSLKGRLEHLLEQTVKRGLVVSVANEYVNGGCSVVGVKN